MIVVVLDDIKNLVIINFLEYIKNLKLAKYPDYLHILNLILFIEISEHLDKIDSIYEKLLR